MAMSVSFPLVAAPEGDVCGRLRCPDVASWKLDEASGWESRPGRRRSAG
jgi:hypothetical protein